jgi:hypothetical protein
MGIIIDNKIQKATEDCDPCQIAVAYIGKDWKKYIRYPEKLESIVLSPTIGSNPYAIRELAKIIGWSKVYFFDQLHAKIYFGKNSAVVGSANLTHNGLSGHSLFELSVEIKNKSDLQNIKKILKTLKNKSEKQYPTNAAKKNKIIELEKKWGNAIANGIFPKKITNDISFSTFELLSDKQFYVAWYQPTDCEYSEDIKAMKSVLGDDIHFRTSDNVEKNKWVLTWRITNKSKPNKKTPLSWLYIDEIFENGIVDKGYDYKKCAFERTDKLKPAPPFEITDEVEKAFKKAVTKTEIAKYLVQDQNDLFDLQYSFKGLPLLIKKMKDYI